MKDPSATNAPESANQGNTICFSSARPRNSARSAEDEARILVSISTVFDSDGSHAPEAINPNLTWEELCGLPASDRTWFDYDYEQANSRLLDLLDEFQLKMTCLFTAPAATDHQELATEMAKRGHEIALGLGKDDSPEALAEDLATIKKVTRKTPRGYRSETGRLTPQTAATLQELGMIYQIGNPQDRICFAPTIDVAGNGPLVTIPEAEIATAEPYGQEGYFFPDLFQFRLEDAFDRAYQQDHKEPVVLAITLHHSLCGAPGLLTALRNFLTHVTSHSGVRFIRQDQLAIRTLMQPPVPISQGLKVQI